MVLFPGPNNLHLPRNRLARRGISRWQLANRSGLGNFTQPENRITVHRQSCCRIKIRTDPDRRAAKTMNCIRWRMATLLQGLNISRLLSRTDLTSTFPILGQIVRLAKCGRKLPASRLLRRLNATSYGRACASQQTQCGCSLAGFAGHDE